MRIVISGLGLLLTLSFAAPAHAAEIDWAKVDAALGKTASVQGEVHRYAIPRTDLQATSTALQSNLHWLSVAGLPSSQCKMKRWPWVTSCSPRPR